MALAVLMVSAVAGGFMGCGSSSPRKVSGTAGTNGGTAGSGTAGTGAAGSTAGTAGTTGTAGDGGTAGSTAGTTGTAGADAGATAGTTGTAGTGGTAGTTGTAGTAPPPTCDNMAKKALPYDVLADFTSANVLHTANSSTAWKMVANPDCNTTYFPALTPTDGGASDASADAASDAAADGGVVDAPADAPVDVASDGGGAASCIEMTYDPDACIAAGGDTGNNCWDGVIFSPSSTIGTSAPGICIADGATKITFEARASRPVMIKFGGIGSGDGTGTFEFVESVTTSWTQFTLLSPTNLPSYNTSTSLAGVWNGFSAVGAPTDGVGGVYILVRNVRWVK